MNIRTINIDDLGIDQINNILQFNLSRGWKFLGYGFCNMLGGWVSIMSFRHDDYTEEVEFRGK